MLGGFPRNIWAPLGIYWSTRGFLKGVQGVLGGSRGSKCVNWFKGGQGILRG